MARRIALSLFATFASTNTISTYYIIFVNQGVESHCIINESDRKTLTELNKVLTQRAKDSDVVTTSPT